MSRQQEVLEKTRQTMLSSEMVSKARSRFHIAAILYIITIVLGAMIIGLLVSYMVYVATSKWGFFFLIVPLWLIMLWGIIMLLKSPVVPNGYVSFLERNGLPLKPLRSGWSPCLWPVAKGSQVKVPVFTQQFSTVISFPNLLLDRQRIPGDALNCKIKMSLDLRVADYFKYAYGALGLDSCMREYLCGFLRRTLEGDQCISRRELLSPLISGQMISKDIETSQEGRAFLENLSAMGIEIDRVGGLTAVP